jgi:hypothetical protein
MGNVWGTANPLIVPTIATSGSDIVLTAGAFLGIFQSPNMIGPSPGNYYPMVFGTLAILLGATPPTALNYYISVNGGSGMDQQFVPAALLIANATLNLPIFMIGTSSGTAFSAPGGYVSLGAQAITQPATFKFATSRMIVTLFRGPDA